MEKPIFILGLPRSGSTVWHNIIGRNSSICRIAEIHFLSPWHKDFSYFRRTQVGDLSTDENVRRMVDLIFSRQPVPGLSSWFWNTQIHRGDGPSLKDRLYLKILASDRSLGSIFKVLIEQVTESRGQGRCCVKFPVYPSHISKLLQWYPNCRIVHITRDPRATSISKTSDPGGTQKLTRKYPRMSFIIRKMMILFVIIQYNWTSKIHRRYKNLDNYALFRYEDLLVDPESVIKELCDFIEVDFCQEMLEIKGAQKSSITGSKSAGIDRRVGLRWKQVISPFEEWMVTLLTKRAMARFGFVPKIHPLYRVD